MRFLHYFAVSGNISILSIFISLFGEMEETMPQSLRIDELRRICHQLAQLATCLPWEDDHLHRQYLP
ncbi:hypothetical protein VNO80_10459 [Phaseolus coccineus]|uniref:Uncharacterized protein n=1 Tax=Phaseolus coccineus TaxID=3886 RepID=A0AAN9REN1_PHACN